MPFLYLTHRVKCGPETGEGMFFPFYATACMQSVIYNSSHTIQQGKHTFTLALGHLHGSGYKGLVSWVLFVSFPQVRHPFFQNPLSLVSVSYLQIPSMTQLKGKINILVRKNR